MGGPFLHSLANLFVLLYICLLEKPSNISAKQISFSDFFSLTLMEDSSADKASASMAAPDAAPEESGWTSYLQDFSRDEDHQQEPTYFSVDASFGSPSLVSDAASGAPWNAILNNNNNRSSNQAFSSSPVEVAVQPKQLSFKKTRTKEISRDDSLEDTASSPVNSPKVSSLKPVESNPRKREDNIESSLKGKGGGSGFCSEFYTDDRENKMTYEDKNIDEYTELKKRGLCLVPFSMLVNYLG
ncbi:vascular-related unknown protein 1 [Diospyros lotus]|uniref:vascular-related unknown protein 1 n=1 Tax=Diospyros lotus TaxID=55363 RepID=UPI00225755AD|nr:vascular-related unknown protein 1 [Diospyros lotus]